MDFWLNAMSAKPIHITAQSCRSFTQCCVTAHHVNTSDPRCPWPSDGHLGGFQLESCYRHSQTGLSVSHVCPSIGCMPESGISGWQEVHMFSFSRYCKVVLPIYAPTSCTGAFQPIHTPTNHWHCLPVCVSDLRVGVQRYHITDYNFHLQRSSS